MTRREFVLAAAVAAQPVRPRLRRKDCFFGLHFDLHPNKNDTALGRDLSDEMAERLIERVRPDYIQYDCKGHAGYLGYQSKVGTSSPGIVKDSLAIWRRATAKHGVALFIHFSGVWDSLAVEQHPEWARVRPDAKKEDRQTCTFGPYVDRLMIPQLIEAATNYDLDGAWVDGECWATNPDYCEAAARAFRQATGIATLPKGPQDKGWREFLEVNREQFRRYVRHYVDAVHKARPGFQIASNWLYTTFVPERPELPVDFLSCDYLGDSPMATARIEARYLASVGMPWDLMAWGFHSGPLGHVHKHAVQVMQEAAVVLAQGGGFQCYWVPTRSGRFDDRLIEVMAEVGRFCRARQALSHRSETVPQVGLLFSKHSLYNTQDKLFGGWPARALDPVRGLLAGLVESHYSVDVIPDWKLAEVARAYPVMVVAEWPDIGAEAKAALVEYARGGGQLLVVGAENARLFAAELGVSLVGAAAEPPAFVTGDRLFGNVKGFWQEVKPEGAQVIERRFPTYDVSQEGTPAATLHQLGQGRIAAIYGPIGSVFAATHAPATRQFLSRVVRRLFTPMVEIDGPPTLEVALRRKNGKLLVHLSNATGMQVSASYAATDFIPPVGPIGVRLRLKKKPERVTWEPGGARVEGEWRGGMWHGTIERLEIHGILAVG